MEGVAVVKDFFFSTFHGYLLILSPQVPRSYSIVSVLQLIILLTSQVSFIYLSSFVYLLLDLNVDFLVHMKRLMKHLQETQISAMISRPNATKAAITSRQ